MPEEKKDSKSKKAVKKTKKPSEKTKTAKAAVKISKEVIIEPITTNEIIEETTTLDSTAEEIKNEEISSDQFLKDFDWDNFEEGIETVKDDKLLEFDKLIQENFVDIYV